MIHTSMIRTALNKVNANGWLGPAMAVGGAGVLYGMNRAEGYSVPASLLKTGGETALYYMFPWLIAPQIVAGVAPVAVPAALDWTSKRQSFLKLAPNRGYIGGWYKDTRAAYTMRQQAAQAIESSFANVALGNEARMFFSR